MSSMFIKSTSKKGIFGDGKNQRRARAVLPILMLRAQEHRTITFKELGEAISFRRYDLFNSICDYINVEHQNLSENNGWDYGEIPTLTTIVIPDEDEKTPSKWMCKQMHEQLHMEDTWENYERYCIQPVFDYSHWDKVMDAIIQSSNW